METDPEMTRKIEFIGGDMEAVTITEFRTFRKVEEGQSVLNRCGPSTKEPHWNRTEETNDPLCGVSPTAQETVPPRRLPLHSVNDTVTFRWFFSVFRVDLGRQGGSLRARRFCSFPPEQSSLE